MDFENGFIDIPNNENNGSKTSTNEYLSVPQFYAGRSLFITGATGFMGKVLVEKLLRSCSGIKNIYLLIRPKRGQDINARLNELLNSPIFNTIRREKPHELSKVIPINGDITLEDLGISESDQALLCRSVSVVFHSAATVKFDEKLKLSVTINMLGTKRLVKLCHRMLLLEALIHVSTAYCNCDRTDINEIIYATPFQPDDIISLINWMPEHLLDKFTPSLIGKRPNTYTFTKALAEQMLLKEAGNLPVAIVRPSIVIASVKEPTPGWVDNWNGPTGIVSAVGNGLFRTIICEKNYTVDLIPVDIVINLMIVAGWKVGTSKTREMRIYNCCTSPQNPISWDQFVGQSIEQMIQNPLEDVFWYPSGTLRTNRILNIVFGYAMHYIPSYLLDMFAYMCGKKPIMIKIQDKLAKSVDCLEYFTTHQWRFSNSNVRELLKDLQTVDREEFQFDVAEIHWRKYIEQYVLGFREYLFKQNPSTLERCRKKMVRLYWIHQCFKILSVILIWRFVLMRSKRVQEVWATFFNACLGLMRLLPFA